MSHGRSVSPARQVAALCGGHTWTVDETTTRRRPVCSWPSALLPGLLVVATLSAAVPPTQSSDERPVMEMEVVGTR